MDEEWTLDELPLGETGLVVSLDLEGPVRRRLLDLGFVPGAEVTAVRVSPLGDPIEYHLLGVSYALRREQARHIRIKSDARRFRGS